jgi:hypothetical protein
MCIHHYPDWGVPSRESPAAVKEWVAFASCDAEALVRTHGIENADPERRIPQQATTRDGDYGRRRRIWSSHLPLSRNLDHFPGHAIKGPISAAVASTGNSCVFRHSVLRTGFSYVLAESRLRRRERSERSEIGGRNRTFFGSLSGGGFAPGGRCDRIARRFPEVRTSN